MQKTLVFWVSVVFSILLAGCGSSESNNESSADITCVHGTHKCIGNALYYCGYSGNDLIWQFSKECDDGCDSSTMQCKSPSQDSDIDSDHALEEQPGHDESDSDHASEEQPDHEEDSEPETRTTECSNLPENAEWNTVSSITQTKEGASWIPSSEGEYNTDPSTEECRFKCKSGYVWNGTECLEACDPNPCEPIPCTGIENSTEVCVKDDDFTKYSCECAKGFLWSGEECLDPCSPNLCRNVEHSTKICTAVDAKTYNCECNEHYIWNESTLECDAESRFMDCSSKPAKSVWNDNGADGKFIQEWSGTTWEPEIYTSSYSETGGVCRFKCIDGYIWNETTCLSKCSNTSEFPCKDLRSGLIWSKRTSTSQNWTSAIDYCANLEEGELSDWRLPNIDELRTLVKGRKTMAGGACNVSESLNCLSDKCWNCLECAEACSECDGSWTNCVKAEDGKYSIFGDTSALWSSSLDSDATEYVWIIGFIYGSVAAFGKDGFLYVRCVR